MEQVKISCPKCKAVLKIKKAILKQNKQVVIACPACNHQLRLQAKQTKKEIEQNLAQTKVSGLENASSNNVRYVLVQQGDYNQTFDLDQPYLTFGRAAKSSIADLQFDTDDLSISRKHCIFRCYPYGITIEDSSKGGTYLNGSLLNLNEETYLKNQDELKIGNSTFLVRFVKENLINENS